MYFVFASRQALSDSAKDTSFVYDKVADYSKTAAQNTLAKDFTAHALNKKMSQLFLQKFAEIIA